MFFEDDDDDDDFSYSRTNHQGSDFLLVLGPYKGSSSSCRN
jgi:hypothetical protein